MSSLSSNTTHDHQEIRHWVEKRGGVPAKVKDAESGDDYTGLLKIRFLAEGDVDDQLEQISWEDFFEDLDENNLDFLYDDQEVNGELSNFYKFVSRGEQ